MIASGRSENRPPHILLLMIPARLARSHPRAQRFVPFAGSRGA
jgi:hypothetical protein